MGEYLPPYPFLHAKVRGTATTSEMPVRDGRRAVSAKIGKSNGLTKKNRHLSVNKWRKY